MDEKESRIVEARMKLRERFQGKMTQTPAAADARPLGRGPPNRHGMPKLPEGQTVTTGWPVLDLGRQPNVQVSKWELIVDGAVEEPMRLSTVLALALPKPEATHLMTYGYDGYTTNIPLEEALKDDVLLVHAAEGKPLPVEHGGPARIITPQLYAWKGAKWVHRIELLTRDRLGFWELRGYSNTAHPWRNDRYS